MKRETLILPDCSKNVNNAKFYLFIIKNREKMDANPVLLLLENHAFSCLVELIKLIFYGAKQD